GGPLRNIAAEREGGGDRLLDRLRQSLGLALDAAGERIPLPFGFRDGTDEAAGASHQCNVERAYGCHSASSPPAREKAARRQPKKRPKGRSARFLVSLFMLRLYRNA